jgi:hypothetical protein
MEKLPIGIVVGALALSGVPFGLAIASLASNPPGVTPTSTSTSTSTSPPPIAKTAPPAPPSAAPSAVAAPKPTAITQDSVVFMPVGKWDRKEGDKKDYLWWSIRNTAPHTLTFVAVTIYYYDLKQRQIGRKTLEQKLSVPKGATRELQIGVAKQWEPKGTQYRDAVFTKATFDDGTTIDDPNAAPEQKPYRGAIPVPTPD